MTSEVTKGENRTCYQMIHYSMIRKEFRLTNDSASVLRSVLRGKLLTQFKSASWEADVAVGRVWIVDMWCSSSFSISVLFGFYLQHQWAET